MDIPLRSGDLVYQHPDDRVVYTLHGLAGPHVLTQTRIRPEGDGAELIVQPSGQGLLVYGGINGARYRITLQDDIWVDVKVSSQGVVKTSLEGYDAQGHPMGKHTVVLAMEKGKAIVQDGTQYKLVNIDDMQPGQTAPIVAPSRGRVV